MMNLKVSISDRDFKKYGLKSDKTTFEELEKLIKRKAFKEALKNSQTAAEEAGLAGMSMDEINEEIRLMRLGRD